MRFQVELVEFVDERLADPTARERLDPLPDERARDPPPLGIARQLDRDRHGEEAPQQVVRPHDEGFVAGARIVELERLPADQVEQVSGHGAPPPPCTCAQEPVDELGALLD